MVRADLYEILLRFPRLFPDPVLFEDPTHLASRFLSENGLSKEKSQLVYQTTDDILPVDDRGKPSATSGTARYPFEGRIILAEFMANANVRLDYADFGTGLSPEDHSKLWTRGKVGELRFELREFKHQSQTFNLPEVSELYTILKARAMPSTISTIELENLPNQAFRAALAYIKENLRNSATTEGLEVEVYAARDLSASEKAALERRLTRESAKSTIFVILSQSTVLNPQTIGE